jgi:hypothetical protein
VRILSDLSPVDQLQWKRVSTAGCLKTSVSVSPFVSCVRNVIGQLHVLCVDCAVRRSTLKAFCSSSVHSI